MFEFAWRCLTLFVTHAVMHKFSACCSYIEVEVWKNQKKIKDAIFGSKEIVGWKQIVQKLWVPKILCSKNEFGAKINLIPKWFWPKRILDKKKSGQIDIRLKYYGPKENFMFCVHSVTNVAWYGKNVWSASIYAWIWISTLPCIVTL